MKRKDLIKALEEIENNYTLIALRDCYNEDTIYGVIYLNNKHSIQDFQNAINKAKEKRVDEIDEYGDDWSFISEELTDFDYIEVGCYECEDYVEF